VHVATTCALGCDGPGVGPDPTAASRDTGGVLVDMVMLRRSWSVACCFYHRMNDVHSVAKVTAPGWCPWLHVPQLLELLIRHLGCCGSVCLWSWHPTPSILAMVMARPHPGTSS
jgi:hypothetical protein